MIGPFWGTISLAVFTAVMSSIGVGLWKQEPAEYMPFLASGMMVWLMLSTMITEGGNMFISSQHLNRMRMDYSILAYALVWRNLVSFFHNLAVYLVIVAVFLPKLITPSILLVVPGLLLVAVNAVWVALLLGMICVQIPRCPATRCDSLADFAIRNSGLLATTPFDWVDATLSSSISIHFSPSLTSCASPCSGKHRRCGAIS